jgi:hypothetical protein
MRSAASMSWDQVLLAAIVSFLLNFFIEKEY